MTEDKKKLEVGEKYLNVVIGGVKIALFPNKDKQGSTSPDFTGHIPVALWVNKKKESKEVKVEDVL